MSDFVHRGVRVLVGDAPVRLAELDDDSIDCCVTSPPYWGLRDYGHDGQIGLESSINDYIEKLVIVFGEVKRVLKPHGSLWLNIGDSYAGSGGPGSQYDRKAANSYKGEFKKYRNPNRRVVGVKSKDLCGIPWRLAFALQADGWWLRRDIIWHKPNCMPESVKDRPTTSHEYLFLLTKSPTYFYDSHAIRESPANPARVSTDAHRDYPSVRGADSSNPNRGGYLQPSAGGRNKRSVWSVNPKPYRGAHFAVFPPELIEPCVLAGTSAVGCCSECGAPHERQTEGVATKPPSINKKASITQTGGVGTERLNDSQKKYHTIGWEPTCDCDVEVEPAVVLDPFGGSGTVGGVAMKHNRFALLIELNPDYAKLIPKRVDTIASVERMREAEHEKIVRRTDFGEWFG